MKSRLVILAALALIVATGATAKAEVVYSDRNVRFTLVDEATVRMEYAPDGKFINNKSFVAVERNYAAVKHTRKVSGKKLTIVTPKMTLTYKLGSGAFNNSNLKIEGNAKAIGTKIVWQPGMQQKANLKGTYRTLDGYDGNMHGDKPMPIEDGLLARDGWTLIDDSGSLLFDGDPDWDWVTTRPSADGAQDWYFMIYGTNYKQALKSFTRFAGNVPLPPRYAFGYWWSRYWSYSDQDFRDLIGNFKSLDIPLDVLVVDMDWHPISPEAGGGWTGWDWNERLFPDYKQFLKFLDDAGVKTTMNLHPADGVRPYEKRYAEFARRYGNTDGKAVQFLGSDKRFVKALFDTYLHPYMDEGVDFWWLDWQQWLTDKKVEGLSNTFWCNYIWFSDMQRQGKKRPMLYHRWGGLGNHRYQIGFSGDAIISWKSLDFQPYYNSTASNVLYGYWSHDIGGHMGADSIDPEMYIRWMQFGAFSPILRTHSTKNAGLNKEPWVFADKERDIIRDIIKQRYSLAPYIYTMARHAYDTGVSLCRPMYYDYPDAQESYSNRNEYMFGDNYLVYPITQPMNNGVSLQKVWLPAGNDWYELTSGTMLKGGQTVERRFLLDEYPIYVKAGSIIPQYGDVKNLRRNDEAVTVTVYPGNVDAQFVMYEDNGNDKQYATAYASTLLSATHSADGTLRVSIGARKGEYSGMPAHRQYRLKLVASAVPEKVVVDGKQTNFEYDGNNLSLTVDIPETDCSKAKTIEVVYAKDAPVLTDGLIGKFRHIQQNCIAVKYRNPGIVFAEPLGTMESAGIAMTYNPEKQKQIVETFRKNYVSLADILKQNGIEGEDARKFMLAE